MDQSKGLVVNPDPGPVFPSPDVFLLRVIIIWRQYSRVGCSARLIQTIVSFVKFSVRVESTSGVDITLALFTLSLLRALALPGPAAADSAVLLSVITRIGLSYLGFVCAARHKTRGRVVAQKIDVSTFTELPVTSLCRLWTPLHTGAGGGKHMLYHEQNIPTFPWIIDYSEI